MFGLSGMTTKIVITLVAMAAIGSAITYGIKSLHDYGRAQKDAGYQEARTDALTRGVELVKERDNLNANVKRTATHADVCARLGGKWVSVNGDKETGDCN
jgi:hypothetical protein